MVCSKGLYEENHMPNIRKENFTTNGVVPETPLEENRAITRGLMILSARALAQLLEKEPDVYTIEDLKVRFR